MGRLASDGARDRPARRDLGRSPALHLGLAKPAPFLLRVWTARHAISLSTTCSAIRPIATIL